MHPREWLPVFENHAGTVEAAFFPDKTPATQPYFWPTSGDYPIYDAFHYELMSGDRARNRIYTEALDTLAPGKIVVDIGTGAHAIWALCAARAGARKVYALERDPAAAAAAREKVSEEGFSDTIEIIEGHSDALQIPEKAEVCVSEIIGEIGGSEGMATYLNDVRSRHLLPGAITIPHRVSTYVALATLPEPLSVAPGFDPEARTYIESIFSLADAPFDLRLAIERHQRGSAVHWLSEGVTLEEILPSQEMSAEWERSLTLDVCREGQADGLVAWVEIECHEGGAAMDIRAHDSNWIPVFFPLWPKPIRVAIGDQIQVDCHAELRSGNCPDYTFSVSPERHPSPARFHSPHLGEKLFTHPFYEKLFRHRKGRSNRP